MANRDLLDGDQLALFDVAEVPQSASKEAPEPERNKDPEDLLEGWVKARTAKKSIAEMMAAVNTVLEAGVPYEDLAFLLSRKHLFPSQAKFSLADLRVAYRSLSMEKKLAQHEDKAAKILSSWGSRSTVSQASLRSAREVVTKALANGVDEEKIKYAFSHRTLLSSKKKVDAPMLAKALERVEADKRAGSLAVQLFQPWYDKWYVGRYTQPPGQIIPLLKSALLSGIPTKQLGIAIDAMGRSQQVFTAPSLQYAIMQAEKAAKNREAAGAHSDLAPESEFDMLSEQSFSNDEFREESPW